MNLQVVQLIFQILTTIFIIYLTITAVKFAAKPKLKVRFADGKTETELPRNARQTIRLYVENVGHWYTAKPAARKTLVYANFDPAFEPIEIRYGSRLERSNREVKIGKDGRKYLETEDIIYLYHGEPGEYIEVDVKTPAEEGRYPIYIPIRSEEGSYEPQRLWLNIV